MSPRWKSCRGCGMSPSGPALTHTRFRGTVGHGPGARPPWTRDVILPYKSASLPIEHLNPVTSNVTRACGDPRRILCPQAVEFELCRTLSRVVRFPQKKGPSPRLTMGRCNYKSGRQDLNRLRKPRLTKTPVRHERGPLPSGVLCLSLGRTHRHRPRINWDGFTGVIRHRPLPHQPITHEQACTGLHSGASWEQIGNSIGNVSPMRPQCENTKVATCEPWIRRL